MEIKAKSQSTVEEFLEAREWHWKKYGILQYLWYLGGLTFILIGLFKFYNEGTNISKYLLIFGVYCLLRKKLLEFWFRRSIKSLPIFNKEIEWQFSTIGFTQHSQLGTSELTWSSIYRTYSTKDGYLIYPHKNSFYWIPKSGFKSDEDFIKTGIILKEKTTHKSIS